MCEVCEMVDKDMGIDRAKVEEVLDLITNRTVDIEKLTLMVVALDVRSLGAVMAMIANLNEEMKKVGQVLMKEWSRRGHEALLREAGLESGSGQVIDSSGTPTITLPGDGKVH